MVEFELASLELDSASSMRILGRDDLNFMCETLRINGIQTQVKGRMTVVFAYPGIGVGEIYPELSGCTGQVCDLKQAFGLLEEAEIALVGLSTEEPARRRSLGVIPFEIGRLQTDLSGLFTQVIRDNRAYLKRKTLIALPDGRLLEYGDITDAKQHAREVIDLALKLADCSRFAPAA
ncbi:hypothetical protein [Aestuariispira insulae]|uniref:Peroxiredoxin n=1 Tax=Aestuariispira insulae TaxID=1461337 RepID=A0A3D9HKA9_9PROT|nr:hypothetical protein [Aestuariispira insulae]RED49918.1 peroxiredoxin [Aestuariispira insulae]